MEIPSLRAQICCHGETQAAFDKLAVASVGREGETWKQVLDDVCSQGDWRIALEIIIFLSFRDIFPYS